MSMTDPIADLLTRIRNAKTIRRPTVDVPASNLKEEVVKALLREGFVDGVDRIEGSPGDTLKIRLKYRGRRTPVITALKRVSRPGHRVYAGVADLPVVRSGLGIAILSTPKGVLSDSECRRDGVGGEVLCYVW